MRGAGDTLAQWPLSDDTGSVSPAGSGHISSALPSPGPKPPEQHLPLGLVQPGHPLQGQLLYKEVSTSLPDAVTTLGHRGPGQVPTLVEGWGDLRLQTACLRSAYHTLSHSNEMLEST